MSVDGVGQYICIQRLFPVHIRKRVCFLRRMFSSYCSVWLNFYLSPTLVRSVFSIRLQIIYVFFNEWWKSVVPLRLISVWLYGDVWWSYRVLFFWLLLCTATFIPRWLWEYVKTTLTFYHVSETFYQIVKEQFNLYVNNIFRSLTEGSKNGFYLLVYTRVFLNMCPTSIVEISVINFWSLLGI